MEFEAKEKEAPKMASIDVHPMSFASKIIMDKMDVDHIEISSEKNYSKIENGDFDIAMVPAYLGPYFYNRTGGEIKIAAITQAGNIHMVSDKKISGQADYRNKNFYLPDLAGNLRSIVDKKIGPLNLILRLNIEYYKSMDDILDKMDKTSDYVAILSEPFYTKALRTTHYVSKVSDLLPVSDAEFLTEIVIVNEKYLSENKEDFDKFLEAYKKSLEDLKTTKDVPENTQKDYELTKKEAELSIERSNFDFVDGEQMEKSFESFMDKLEQADAKIFDGERPGEDLYYKN